MNKTCVLFPGAAGLVLLILLLGCDDSDERIFPRDLQLHYQDIELRQVSAVDLLFVIGNSNSMPEEQAVLTAQFENAMVELLAPGNEGQSPVRDIRIGVIDPDLGTSGYFVQSCPSSARGSAGALHFTGRLDGCAETYEAANCAYDSCPWLSHTQTGSISDESISNLPLIDDFACLAMLGTEGCLFEQPLEATLMALTMQLRPGGENEGFLRDDSLLAVVWITDNSDCSTPNPEMFNPDDDDLGPLEVRCLINEDELYSLERYYNGLRSLRPGAEDLVVVGAIAGIPADGRDWLAPENLDELQSIAVVNPENPNEQLESCDTDMGLAYPPTRIAELVAMFGDNGVLGSICRHDWSDTFRELMATIRERLSSHCLAEPLDLEPSQCRVVERLLDDGLCPDSGSVRGSERDIGLDSDGRRHCVVPAVHDTGGGWRLDRVMTECTHGELVFDGAHNIALESELRFECNRQ